MFLCRRHSDADQRVPEPPSNKFRRPGADRDPAHPTSDQLPFLTRYRTKHRETVSIPMTDLESLRNQLRTFAADRDWDQFHSPKNLAAALAVEAAELLEHFQWLTEAQSQQLPPDALAEVRAEVADVLLYLIRISDKLGIDLIAAANAKIELNAAKYPVNKARGSSKKYTEL